MFEVLFTYAKVLARHQVGPAAAERERYLAHCAGQGAAHGTLLRIALGTNPTSARSDGFPRWLQGQSTNKTLILLTGRERKQQNQPM